ncbi:hypothetical protein MHTCC0001_09640 [Flavobacteriaceae bacterium MHTCC 0001]
MFQSQTISQAKNYFRDALSKADYYIEDQEMNGIFNGKIAKRLGIEGKTVDKDIYDKLCDNINPKDGSSLTPRTVENRRVGYDISFHAPKSVSVLYALGDDDRVLKSFEQSVYETMLEIEANMQTRVRTQGQYTDRDAPELIWADFTHQTARPTKEAVADVHLHQHCYVWNCVFDSVENRFKAGQFHNIKRDMPYYQARFHKRLADKLSDLGYGIRKTHNGFEVAVIPQQVIDLFSKRTNHIGQVAWEKGITNPKELDQLGAKTRAKKQKNLTMPELKSNWVKQIEDAGIDEQTPEEAKTTDKTHTAKQSIDFAIETIFTRKSVMRDRQILAEGYKHAIDNNIIAIDEIDRALEQNDNVFKIQVGSQRLCTTESVHAQELKMINLAREGIGKFRPLKHDFVASMFKHLNDEQRLVLQHVMTSQDQIVMIRGGAGTGKTTLFKTLVPEIEETGKKAFLFAPTAEASRGVLRGEGFEQADTVARLLKDKKLQEEIYGQVVIIDEAGMLGTQDMASIQELINQQKAKLIISGDPKQHPAVLRGDAMRLLRDVGKIPQVSLETIYRQKNEDYKTAVKEIDNGNIKTGFAILNDMGSIKEAEPREISQQMVDEYLENRKEKKSALVVTPTREQMKRINDNIRQGLRNDKLIGKREKQFTVFENYHLTVAQKQDTRFYQKGQIVQAMQNLPSVNGGIKKGSALTVAKIEDKTVYVTDRLGRDHILPTQKAKDYDLYRKKEINLSKGDEIRIVNKNGFDEQKKRLDSKTILKVSGFTKEGHIKAIKESAYRKTEFILNKEHSNFEYAYAITSYASQGKTVDKIIVSQPASTFLASNEKQFYVSVSRGRESVSIYTDDKEDLLTAIQRYGDRQGATELIKTEFTPIMELEPQKAKYKEIEPIKTIDYEPDI